jgi:acyl-CoA thioesterase-2
VGALSGPNVEVPGYHRLFGGQLLAQALVAAGIAAGADRTARSLHMVFVAEGRPGARVIWSPETVRAGRSFTTVAVKGAQAGRLLATALVSLHVPEAGFEHQSPAPARGDVDSLRPIPPAGAMPCEMRTAGDVHLGSEEVGPPELAVFLRPPRPLATPDPATDQALLAYCSDATMMVAALRPHSAPIGSPALAATSVTSHTVSFHRPFEFAGWMLFEQRSPVAAGGRAYCRGDWFDSGGALVASCAQEMLIRPAR